MPFAISPHGPRFPCYLWDFERTLRFVMVVHSVTSDTFHILCHLQYALCHRANYLLRTPFFLGKKDCLCWKKDIRIAATESCNDPFCSFRFCSQDCLHWNHPQPTIDPLCTIHLINNRSKFSQVSYVGYSQIRNHGSGREDHPISIQEQRSVVGGFTSCWSFILPDRRRQ